MDLSRRLETGAARNKRNQMKNKCGTQDAKTVGSKDLLAGLSVMTVIKLKHAADDHLNYAAGGPAENGKYYGWIYTLEGRQLVNSQPIHENGEAAIAHMKKVVDACRSWESPANEKS